MDISVCKEDNLIEKNLEELWLEGRRLTTLILSKRAMYYSCNECGKRFTKPSLLQRHTVVHITEKPFHCDSCKKCFSQKSSLQRHYLEIHKREKPHKCPKCPLYFGQKVNLLIHLHRTHPLPLIYCSNKQFSCKHCTCAFRSKSSLNRHISQQHLPAEVSESMHYAQLAIAFQDATPVDDADELAQNVLMELKKLQDVMLTNQEHVQKLEYELNTGRSRKCAAINEIVTTNTSHNNSATVVEEGETHIVQLLDKLNPQLETHLITVPCVKRNDGIVNYVCEFCSKEFRKKYNIIRHRRTHSHEAPYKCEHCTKCCITKSKLEQHRKLHNKQSHQYICSICKQHLSSIRDLDMHILKLHYNSHELHYLCLKCSHSFTSLGAFAAHKHQQQDKEYQKLLNLLPSPIITNLYSHTTGINKSDTKCATCDCLFSTKLNLKLHYKIYASHKRYNCGQCRGKSFSTAARLRRHMFTHSNIGNYKCVYCIKTYKTKKHCALHIRKHLNDILDTGELTPHNTSSLELIKNKQYLVVMWEKEQTAQNPLVNNTKSNAPQVNPNHRPCKARRQSSNKCGPLLNPLTNVSLEPDNFNSDRSCMYCKCIFKKPSDLQRHLRKHTKERPFVCEVCGKSFALKATLKEHQLTHIGERRETFDCQVCGKSFSSKKSLVLHLRIHTGIRPFRCQNCRQAFRTSGHFKAHIKTAHK